MVNESGSTARGPASSAAEQLQNALRRIAELEDGMRQTDAQLDAIPVSQGLTEKYRVRPPGDFHGRPGELKEFLLKAKIFLNYHRAVLSTEPKKVMAIVEFFKGNAFD